MKKYLMGMDGWRFVVAQLEKESNGWRKYLPWNSHISLQNRSKCKRSDFLRVVSIILDLWKEGKQNLIDSLALVCDHGGNPIPKELESSLDREGLRQTGLVDEKMKLSTIDQPIVYSLLGGGIDSFSGMWDPWDSLCHRVNV